MLCLGYRYFTIILVFTFLSLQYFCLSDFLFCFRSIGHLATNICAIIGGVFTVAGILDAFLYHSLNAFQNKSLLGKSG